MTTTNATTDTPAPSPIVIGYYIPRAVTDGFTKAAKREFATAILMDVLASYPTAKIEISRGDPDEKDRRLVVLGADVDAVEKLVTESEARHIGLLRPAPPTPGTTRIIGGR